MWWYIEYQALICVAYPSGVSILSHAVIILPTFTTQRSEQKALWYSIQLVQGCASYQTLNLSRTYRYNNPELLIATRKCQPVASDFQTVDTSDSALISSSCIECNYNQVWASSKRCRASRELSARAIAPAACITDIQHRRVDFRLILAS